MRVCARVRRVLARWVVVAAAAAMAAGLLAGVAATPAAAREKPRIWFPHGHPKVTLASGTMLGAGRRAAELAAVSRLLAREPGGAGARYQPPRQIAWPAAGAGTAALTAPTPTGRAGRAARQLVPARGFQRVGRLPVAVAAAGTSGLTGVRVRMSSHGAAVAAGADGALFSLTPAGAGRAQVRVSYAAWAKEYGGDWASRLRLAVLPACALTTPRVAACRARRWLATDNDAAAGTLTASLSLGTPAPAGVLSPAARGAGRAISALTAAPNTVMAVQSGPNGPEGNYTATPLNPAGSWVVQQGDFTYSYPIATPPAVEGTAPDVTLSYGSQSIDGETAASNTQGGWIGDGWNYSPGSITVAYQGCSNDSAAATNDSASECWDGQNATLTLDGTSTPLVLNGGSGTTWTPQDDNGDTVQQDTGANNGLWMGQYWVLTTPDGTQYYFGSGHIPGDTSSSLDTNSAWGVPVINPASGDPCYTSGSGQLSQCTMGWQWNLDYVIDPQGNLTVYTYQDETNEYALGGEPDGQAAGTLTSYVRGGYLTGISYGWQVAQAKAGNVPGDQVNFTSSQRCTGTATECASYANLTSSTAPDWPDTPSDQICPELAGGSCTNYSPTFFSTYMLTGIKTEVAEGSPAALKPVDSWSLTQSFPTGAGEGAQAVLFLDSIQRTGNDQASSSNPAVTLPAVSFGTPVEVDNQVPGSGNPPLFRPRIDNISTESGASISVLYENPACVQGTSGTPPTADANNEPCYPVYWAPQGDTPAVDWFNKSLVSQVTVTDTTSAGSPSQTTTYSYLGGAAWHQNDAPTTTSAYRTWDQYRGFAQVKTTTGVAPDPITQTVDTYLRGMDGDGNSSGGTTAASVAYPSAGPDAGDAAVPDSDWLAGQVLEADTYSASGGTVQKALVDSWPTAWAQTASQAWPSGSGLPSGTSLAAHMPTSADADTMTLQASGGWASDAQTSYYDSSGLITDVDNDPSNAARTCTHTSYANPASGDANQAMVSYPDETYTVTGAYSGTGCPAVTSANVVSDTKTYYDNETSTYTSPGTWGTVQSPGGLPTAVQRAVTWPSGGSETWQGTAAHYTSTGQVTYAQDGDGNATITTYPSSVAGELPTSVKVENPKTWDTTSLLDQARQLPVQVTDPNNEVTSETYDTLGRLTSVTLPADQSAGDPTYKFSYGITGTAPSAVETQTLRADGSYANAFDIYDGMLQKVQTQTLPVNNASKMILFADTSYDSHGWVTSTTAPFATEERTSPSATLFAPVDLAEVPDQTVTAYDGMGRPVSTTLLDDNAQVSQTQTAYPGMNQTDVTPPAGGTATTVLTNALGQTTASWAYSNSAAPDDNPADADITGYTYTPGGQTATVTDAANNTWTYGYNLLGEKTSATDPATTGKATTGTDTTAGTATYGYDADGNMTSATSASGVELTYTYDALGRKQDEYSGTISGTLIDQWVYDGSPLNGSSTAVTLGQLYKATSYLAGNAYTEEVTGYNTAYEPTGTETIIPAVDGAPGGTYTTSAAYGGLTDVLANTGYGNDGGLPPETVSYSWGLNGLLSGFGDNTDYLDEATYDPEGNVQQTNFGPDGKQLAQAYQTDLATGRLTLATTSLQASATVTTDETAYTYNQAGDITSADAIQNPDSASPVPDLQCFKYSDLQELNQAWTDSGSVTPAPGGPAPGGIGGCNDSSPTAATIGGTATYWDVYGYDPLGDRTSLTSHDTASQAVDTTANETSQALAYPGGGTSAAAQPDEDTSVTTAAPSGTVTTTPGYNPNGNTTSVTATGTAGPLFSGVIPSSGALCLDDHGSATTAGNKIDINTCNGSSAEDWTANSNGTLEVLGNCLDVSGNGTAANTVIVLEPCSTSTAGEIWHPGTRGTWVNPHSGDCLADPANSTTTATQLEIQVCSPGTTGQSWAAEQIRYNPQGQVGTVLSGSGAADVTTSYVYDASGNLILQDDNGAVTYYVDGGAEQISYSGATLKGAVRFLSSSPDGIVVVRTSAGAVYYELTNQEGTATELINAASDAITRRYFDPYGNNLGAAPSWPDNKGYVGQPADPDTGLDLLGARQYSPVTGRFLSLDPVFEAGDPTQMGGYSYAADNPVSQSDPSGLCKAPPTGGAPINCDGSPIPPPPSTAGAPDTGSSSSGTPGSSLLPQSARPAYDAFFYGTFMKEDAYNPGSALWLLAAVSGFCGSSNLSSGNPCGQQLATTLWHDWESAVEPMAVVAGMMQVAGVHELGGYLDNPEIRAQANAGYDINQLTTAQEGATAAEGAGSGGTVQIFRHVDAREFDSIATTGKFGTGEGQMEGKWFATQGAHAEQWGQLLNGGEGITVETRIPASVADQLYLHAGKLDGIGPAYYADADQLDLINAAMDGIRAWP